MVPSLSGPGVADQRTVNEVAFKRNAANFATVTSNVDHVDAHDLPENVVSEHLSGPHAAIFPVME
jgi:hypothetical protein